MDGIIIVMVERKEKNKGQKQKKKEHPATGRTTDKSTSSSTSTSISSIIFDPTTLTEKEKSQLKEAIKKAMLDEKGKDKGYFTIGEVTSPLIMLPKTNWTESKVDRVIQESYDKGKIEERYGIGKYTPV